MREKKVFIALILLTNLALIGIMAIQPAFAQVPSIWTANVNNVATEVFPRVALNGAVDVYIKIKDAPQLTHEDDPDPRYGGCAPTDLTWSYSLYVTFDDTVLMLDTTRMIEPLTFWTVPPPPPTTDTAATHMSFLKWGYWTYDVDLGWYVSAAYSTIWAAGFEPGLTNKIGVSMALTAQDTSKPWNFIAIPPEMIPGNPAYVAGCPDEGAHAGIYYDLPYSRLNKNDLLLRLRFKNLDTGGTGGTKWSKIHIEGTLKTIGQMDVVLTPYDAWYGAKVLPEFPLGLAPLILLAPAIPIVYLWRIRKRKVR